LAVPEGKKMPFKNSLRPIVLQMYALVNPDLIYFTDFIAG
jgi:hypothetical protein